MKNLGSISEAKSIVTKEYADDTYAQKSDVTSLTSTVKDVSDALDNHMSDKSNPHNVTKSDIGLGNVGNFKAVSTVANQGLDDNEKANARSNIGASSFSGSYKDLKDKPTIPSVSVKGSVLEISYR